MAHFEPDKITVTGEGVFPRIIFDLPPDKEDSRYEQLTQQAFESLGREKSNLSDKTVDDLPFRALADVSTRAYLFCFKVRLCTNEMHQCQSKFENANLHTNLHRVTKVPLSSGKLKSCTKKPSQRAAVIPTKTLLSSTETDFLLYVTRALHFQSV